jgi:hypoxanthine phosphoribosyltransferase
MTDAAQHPTDGAILTPLITAESIRTRVLELGRDIRADLGPDEVTLLCVLKGSFVFTADLARAIEGPVNVEFLGVASYGMSTESSGAVKITQDLASPIEGKDVVLVEDIIDTGLTLAYLMQILAARRPKRLRIASLLEKPSGNSPVKADYTGFTVGREFVVGYGLDWGERFRNLPYVAKVEAASLDAPA